MVKEVFIVQEGQSLYDISVQLFGHQDGVFGLLWDNPGLDLDALYAGQKLYYTPAVLDKNVLKYIIQKNYVPATAGEMIDAPVPPAPPAQDVVVISQYGMSDVEVTAPGEYEVQPSRIEDGSGNLIQLLGPGQIYDDEPCPTLNITNSVDIVIYTLEAGQDQELPDIQAKNSAETIIGTAPYGNPIPVPDIEVTQADGSTGDAPAGVDVTCLFPELDLVDTDGNVLETVVAMPVGAKIVAPDATVLMDGAPYGTVLAGGNIDVVTGLAPAGIKYQDVIQTHPIATSYATYDYAYNLINGYYDRVHPVTPVSVAELDTTIATANFGYVLKHNNKWGHKYRFTGSTGGYYDAVTATWYTVAGVASTRAVEVADLQVYDHLTGKKHCAISTPNNWANALYSPSTTIAGETGWLCCSADDLLALAINKISGSNNELNDAIPINAVWSSNTVIATSANAYIIRALGAILSHVSLVKTNTTASRLVWKYFV